MFRWLHMEGYAPNAMAEFTDLCTYIPPRPKVLAVCLSPTFLALGARLIVRLHIASEEAFELDVFDAGPGLIGN